MSGRLPDRPRILLVTLRRIGDVLLTTPLAHVLRQRWPAATIDVLVFAGTEGILAGNPDLDRVVVLPAPPSVAASVKLIARLWRRYDVALSTQTGDRPSIMAWAAGRRRIGFVGDHFTGSWWKRHLLNQKVRAGPQHRVAELMRLAECLGVTGPARVVAPKPVPIAGGPSRPYAVVHASPMFTYRRWREDGWRAVAAHLAGRGLAVVATGSAAPAERAYLDRVFGPDSVQRWDGRLTWPELADLLGGAVVYVGPDTSVTHLAAASGCPTVAIYGPISPRLMGPWPKDGLAEPWELAGTVQRRGNVCIVQHPLPCVPCERLGCEGHLESRSQCLDELPTDRVIAAIDATLAAEPRPTAAAWPGASPAPGT